LRVVLGKYFVGFVGVFLLKMAAQAHRIAFHNCIFVISESETRDDLYFVDVDVQSLNFNFFQDQLSAGSLYFVACGSF
jgi:hypothetical protein